VQQHGDRIVVSFSWADELGRRHRWAQTLQIRNGLIVDMQDYRSPQHGRCRGPLTRRIRLAT
jgi:hypothetical protein